MPWTAFPSYVDPGIGGFEANDDPRLCVSAIHSLYVTKDLFSLGPCSNSYGCWKQHCFVSLSVIGCFVERSKDTIISSLMYFIIFL